MSAAGAVEALHPEIEVCHLNEGHAAFAVLERARSFAQRQGVGFEEALWATRAGNVFTTHTPVEAGFDRFSPELLARYGLPWTKGDRFGRYPEAWFRRRAVRRAACSTWPILRRGVRC